MYILGKRLNILQNNKIIDGITKFVAVYEEL